MSVGGLGAFAQGLVQGYQVGDRLVTAEEEREVSRQNRELRGLQIAEEKRKATERGELDALRPQMAQAIGQVLANPTDDASLQNYNDVMAKYYTKANPNEAAVFVKSVREDKLKEGARQAANIFGRLQMQDQTAIAEFARAYKAIPNGVDVDPARSGFTKDGGVKLGLFNTETGQALPDRVVSRDQVVQGFAQFLGSGKDVVDFYQNQQRLGLTARGQDMEYDLGKANLGLRRFEAGQRSQDQNFARQERVFGNDQNVLTQLHRLETNNLKNDINVRTDEKVLAQKTADADAKLSWASMIASANHNVGIRPPPAYLYSNAAKLQQDLLKQESFVKDVPPGLENSGYGMTVYGFIAPLPPGARIAPKK